MQAATLDQINAALQLEIDDALEHSLPREVDLHPFERAKLGTAPFTCVDCTVGVGSHKCAFCTTSLKYLYHIEDVRGRRFIVGSECVKQTGGAVAGFEKFNRQMEARVREMQKLARKERERAKSAAQAEQWRKDYAEEWAYMQKRAAADNWWYKKLCADLDQYGSLYESRVMGIQRDMRRDAAREAEKEVKRVQAAPAPVVNLEPVETAFANAKQAGIKWPKLRLGAFVFSPAGENSANAGAIYIKQRMPAGDLPGAYLGKVMNGRLFKSRDCDAKTEWEILAVAGDPKAAAVAYGKKFGKCSVCNRDLTDEASVAAGIGPICAQRYGF